MHYTAEFAKMVSYFWSAENRVCIVEFIVENIVEFVNATMKSTMNPTNNDKEF